MTAAPSLPVSASPPDIIPTAPDSGVRATTSPEPTSDPARAEELRLVALAKAGDQRAAWALLRMHAGLIHLTCRPYFGNAHDAEDVLQAGRIGFMRGVEGYDASHGTKLWTYCRDWVRLEAHDALIAAFPVIVPRYRHVQMSAEERAGKPSKFARRLRKLLRMGRLDAPVHADGDTTTVADTISGICKPADMVVAENERVALARRLVFDALAMMSARTANIVRRRHVIEEPDTLDVIATDLGCSRENVHQIEERAMRKVRGYIATHTTADERDLLRGT